jgi:hypothetical protein
MPVSMVIIDDKILISFITFHAPLDNLDHLEILVTLVNLATRASLD